jgi:hypothetical protein
MCCAQYDSFQYSAQGPMLYLYACAHVPAREYVDLGPESRKKARARAQILDSENLRCADVRKFQTRESEEGRARAGRWGTPFGVARAGYLDRGTPAEGHPLEGHPNEGCPGARPTAPRGPSGSQLGPMPGPRPPAHEGRPQGRYRPCENPSHEGSPVGPCGAVQLCGSGPRRIPRGPWDPVWAVPVWGRARSTQTAPRGPWGRLRGAVYVGPSTGR